VTEVTFPIPPINYTADLREVEDGPGKVVYTDVTSPQDQPSTLRIAQQSRANIYAGTSIDPAAFLATKRGTDTIIEVRQVWMESDSEDSTYLRFAPVRAALTLSLPDSAIVTPDRVADLVQTVIAALFAQGDDTHTDGIAALLHGVVKKA
jgi:hypothetical protein